MRVIVDTQLDTCDCTSAFANIVVQDCDVKDVQHAAIAVESRQGADVENVGSPFADHVQVSANATDTYRVRRSRRPRRPSDLELGRFVGRRYRLPEVSGRGGAGTVC